MPKLKADISIKSQIIIGVTVALVTVVANLILSWVGLPIESQRHTLLQAQERKEAARTETIHDLDELIAICHQIELPAQNILSRRPVIQADVVAWGETLAPTGKPGQVMLELSKKGTELLLKMGARHQVEIDMGVFQFLNGATALGYTSIMAELLDRPITNFTSIRELKEGDTLQMWIPPSLESIPPTLRPATSPNPELEEFTKMMLNSQKELEQARREILK